MKGGGKGKLSTRGKKTLKTIQKKKTRLGFCELLLEKILLKSNKKKRTVNDRAGPKRGCFQNKSLENSYFRRAPSVELWGERGLPGVPFISPEDSRLSGLRLVCRFEHVFPAPPHHVPVVDPRHRWGGSRLRKICKDVLTMLKVP